MHIILYITIILDMDVKSVSWEIIILSNTYIIIIMLFCRGGQLLLDSII